MHAIQVDHVVKRYKNGVQALNGFTHVINALRSLILYGYIECGEFFLLSSYLHLWLVVALYGHYID